MFLDRRIAETDLSLEGSGELLRHRAVVEHWVSNKPFGAVVGEEIDSCSALEGVIPTKESYATSADIIPETQSILFEILIGVLATDP